MKHIERIARGARMLGGLVAVAMIAGAAHAEGSLYERIGGDAKMRAVVDEFTAIVLADPRINFTFAESDIPKFKKLLFEQLCNITGGPCQYTGRSMKESHEKLNSTNAQFNALAEDLYIAFERTKVPYRLQNQVMVLLAPMQKDIVK